MTAVPRTPTIMALLAFTLALHAHPLRAADPAQLEFFENEVRPLLATHCYECHSVKSKSLKAGLRLDSRSALLKGGDSGPAFSTDKPETSLLLEAVRYEAYEMPPKGKLPARDIAVLEKWVRLGAPWPDEPEPLADSAPPPFDLAARKAAHWCWQPIRAPQPPAVNDTTWPRDDLDRFILARLEQRDFKPAPSVDRRVLLRRLNVDLIGLPPTPAETDAFLHDTAPNAVEKVVDRLLQSPHFGERWARHWLDLVRYAESRGHEFDNDTPNAWQYRDYIIRALNSDVSYDQFVKEHIAGDLLDPPRLHPEKKFNESILGTGFWHLGEWVHSPVDIRKDETDRFDNMLDVMSKTFLGVTVACARCHDHKFDAISQKDYYALSGFLQGSDYRQVPFESLEHNKWLANELAKIDEEANRKLWQTLARAPRRAVADMRGLIQRMGRVPFDGTGEFPSGIQVYVDYRVQQAPILQDGIAYGTHAVRPGALIVTEDRQGNPVVELVRLGYAHFDPVWKDRSYPLVESANQKGRLEAIPRSGRTLRTPTFELVSDKVSCRVRGSGHVVACVDSHRLVAGPLHGETIVQIKPPAGRDWHWMTMNLERYCGHRVHLEFTPAIGKTLDVQMVTAGAIADSDVSVNTEIVDLQTVNSVLSAWDQGKLPEQVHFETLAAIAGTAWAMQSESPEFEQLQGIIKEWLNSRSELTEGISRASGVAPAMLDGSGEDDRLLIRGNSSTPGEVVPRRFLEAIDGPAAMAIPHGSGRRELASRIIDRANPLTTRVIVNRVWHHLLGRGIVPTTDDFGLLGQRPTHPELLDYLATEFQQDGQSLKRLIRRIVLSQTYRMSGDCDPQTIEADPKNDLWHHRPPRRLEGEAIRDALLAVSGRLDRTPFGPSVKVHLTTFMEGRGRPPQSGPPDGAGRRSIYLEVRRNFLSPFMLTFDTPNPFSTMGRRNSSNVPAQALILMNDPFVRDCAESWAKRAIAEAPAETDARIAWLYQTAFNRPPTDKETQSLQSFLNTESSSAQEPTAAWTDIAHAIINTKEFFFIP